MLFRCYLCHFKMAILPPRNRSLISVLVDVWVTVFDCILCLFLAMPRAGPGVINKFILHSTIKFILLINDKIPIIVVILAYMLDKCNICEVESQKSLYFSTFIVFMNS